MELNKDSLEKALQTNDSVAAPTSVTQPPAGSAQPEISKEEEIGFHKGALNTLANERGELFKMMQNVEAIMQAHIKRLEELGIKIQTQQ